VERSSGAAPPRPSGSGDSQNQTDRDLPRSEVERPAESVSIVTLRGELDLGTIPSLEDQPMDELRSNRGVVIDRRRLHFIDSSGIGLLIKPQRSDGGGALLTVVPEGSQVARVFALADIGKALPIFLQRDQALGVPVRAGGAKAAPRPS